MNSNVQSSFKKFISNKNVVTIVGVILIALVLYIGYTWRIKSMTDLVTVPSAKVTISSGEVITSEKIQEIKSPRAALKGTVITSSQQVLGKYANGDSIIPKGSLFYSRSVVAGNDLPGVGALDYPDGYVLVNLDVNMTTTYGNLIRPGEYVDIYLRIKYSGAGELDDDNNKLTVGKLLSNIKILKVVDANGNNVFADPQNKGTPSQIIFAVPSKEHILLRKAIYLKTYASTIIPVPIKVNSDEVPDVTLGSSELESFINRVTAWTGDGSGELQIPDITPAQ